MQILQGKGDLTYSRYYGLTAKVYKFSAMSSVLGRIRKDFTFTGLPSYTVFEALVHLYHHLCPKLATRSGSGLSLADEFLLVLMKLARATTKQDLAYGFNITCWKVSNICIWWGLDDRWIDVMAANLKSFICWPKDVIISNMPDCFKWQYLKQHASLIAQNYSFNALAH